MAEQTGISWAESVKVAARSALNVAVRKGEMPHPSTLPCVDCGQVWAPGLSRHEYDHHQGYDPENWLVAEVVCSKCHKGRDSPKVAQTACIHGHEFTPANTIRKTNGTRGCRACRQAYDRNRRDAAWWREWRQKRKTANG